MIAFDRKQQILELLQKKKTLKVDVLARLLHSSPATIRRDLQQLSEEGLIRRVRGGASYKEDRATDFPLDFRKVHEGEKKRKIAELAADFLQNDQLLFMDSSTTVMAMIPYFKGYRGIHVLTNGLLAAHLLSQNTNVHVTIVGGHVHDKSSSVNGYTAAAFISNYRADVAFLSGKSLNSDGAMEITEEEAAVRRSFIKQAKEKVLLIDSTKFDISCFFQSIKMNELDYILSDKQLPESIGNSAEIHGVESISFE